MKQMLLQFPKLRGFKSRYQKPENISLSALASAFPSRATVNLQALKAKRLVSSRATRAKLIGGGKLASALTLVGIAASASAKAAILKAGGTIKERV